MPCLPISPHILSPTNRFEINLATSNCPDPDLALHFNPRFDENKVVLNTKENGVWCREECRNCVPFHRGQGFELMIIPKQEGFQIVVGDQEYYHFCYRIPLCEVCGLEVRGKVMLESVSIF
ncbi:galectin-7-like [Erinaceus europaeus]|uniref:Galectin n=1 Tax=Erinaceus europaeus TaxID=9365 RepID=A0ABM3X0Q0_ERIEU|nr:galectin-7-like [Erinaceus europaeus]